ncbi:MAG: PIG-L family deacetylase [Alphaproteobacteria bacterium]|nr:PIG-L family deacetylase [Alphaproteobacteria bacterium]
MIAGLRRVLCLSPHPDDTEFGCGATLNRLRGQVEVRLVVFADRAATRGEKHNERDQLAAAQRLGIPAANVKFVDQLGMGALRLPVRFFGTEESRDWIRRTVAHVVRDFDPDAILAPALGETMQDHQAVTEEVVRVERGRAAILGYETPKHNRLMRPAAFVRVAPEDIRAKAEAVNCFTEFTTRYYFEETMLDALARVRAMDAGFHGLAEAFEVYRLVVG